MLFPRRVLLPQVDSHTSRQIGPRIGLVHEGDPAPVNPLHEHVLEEDLALAPHVPLPSQGDGGSRGDESPFAEQEPVHLQKGEVRVGGPVR